MRRNRTELALGLVLVLLGAWFIAVKQIPSLGQWVDLYMSWPLNVVGAGAIIFLLGLILNAPGMAIPAAIVAGIGGILYYQEITKDFESWSYMWTLIIGFVGVGNILAGALDRNGRQARSGLNLIMTSAIMFVIFAAIMGKLAILGPYGPAVLLILAGLWVLGRGLFRRGGDK